MRHTLPLLVLLSLAFAPAPFPKAPGRAGADQISLRTFQGAWKVVSIESVDQSGGKNPIHWNVTRVRVEGDRMTYLADGRDLGQDRLSIADGKPALIDFYPLDREDGKPYRVGLIKREGGRVIMLFYQVGPEARARSFEQPPPSWWWAVFERER